MCNENLGIEDSDYELKKVKVLKKFLHSFEKKNVLQNIDENKISDRSDQKRVFTKVYHTQALQKPMIIGAQLKDNLWKKFPEKLKNSYNSSNCKQGAQLKNDMPIIYNETKYSSKEIGTSKAFIPTGSSNIGVDDFLRNSRLTKSCKECRSGNTKFYRSNSLRVTQPDITKKFVVNLYESRNSRLMKQPGPTNPTCNEVDYSLSTKTKKMALGFEDNNCNRNAMLSANILDSRLNEPKDQNDNVEERNWTETEKKCEIQLNISTSTDSGYSDSQHKKVGNVRNSSGLFFKLKEKADIQGHIMKQASAALETLRKKKVQKPSLGEILAEKILLISSFTHKAIIEEIRQNEYENMMLTDEHSASLTVSGIRFNLKDNILDDDHQYYFVCILSNGSTVQVTETVEAKRGQKAITFQNTFAFDDLDIDFTLNVNVYWYKFKKIRSNFPFNKVRSCCTSRKILYKDRYSCDVIEADIRTSSFSDCGSLQVQINDLNKSVWDLDAVPSGSPLTGKSDLKFVVNKLNISCDCSGFLTVGTIKNMKIVWNRMWCRIKGSNLMFWNYPSDENINPPANIVDIRKILNEVDLAKRSFCPRPRTLFLEVEDFQVGYYILKEYYLSADSTSEVEQWKSHLNSIRKFLNKWSTNNGTYL